MFVSILCTTFTNILFESISTLMYRLQQNSTKPKASVIVHYLNATYIGHYSSKIHVPEGPGMIIDDEFNLFISKWEKGNLNGHSFIKLNKQDITMYGEWQNGKISGIHVFKYKKMIIYGNCVGQKQGKLESPLIAHNTIENILYTLQIEYKDATPVIKIINRLTNNSHNLKQIGKILKIDIREHFLSPIPYLTFLTQIYPNFMLTESSFSDRYLYFGTVPSTNLHNKALGMIFNYDLLVKSIGMFNQNMELNGIGISENKDFHTFIGLFKEGILHKEFSSVDDTILTKTTTKLLLRHEHSKSLVHQYQIIYFPILRKIKIIVFIIDQFIQTFEGILRKHNPKVQDSLNNDSSSNSSSVFQNVKYEQSQKYLQNQNKTNKQQINNLSMKKKEIFRDQKVDKKQIKMEKKPGFIYSRSKSPIDKHKSPINDPIVMSPSTGIKGRKKFSPSKTFIKNRPYNSPPKQNWKI